MDQFIVNSMEQVEDYRRVAQAIEFLERNYRQQPSLDDVAGSVGLSEYHFQRLFARWAGISPKRFLQFLTKEHARQMLEHSASLMEAAYESGLSGPGRLHDLFISTEAVTPGELKHRGEGLQIYYGIHATLFGECLLAVTARGISDLIFVEPGGREPALQVLRRRWNRANLEEDMAKTGPLVSNIFARLANHPGQPLHLFLSGTNFQIKVWEALLRVPSGEVVTYAGLAQSLGMPGAARAVGQAVGHNPLPVIIPCHRVIRKAGDFGNYRYGSARKKALLLVEDIRRG